MTLTQLERYMISEVENLHLKVDAGFEMFERRFQEMMEYMTLRFDRIEKRLDEHNVRIVRLENSYFKHKS